MVRGNAAWLSRAIENLVTNARIHGEPEGTVRVRLERQGDELVCEVRNAGQIPKPLRGRVFRRFVTTRADRGGTGLGLALVRAVAEAHGGQVECTSPGPPEVSFQMRLPAS